MPPWPEPLVCIYTSTVDHACANWYRFWLSWGRPSQVLWCTVGGPGYSPLSCTVCNSFADVSGLPYAHHRLTWRRLRVHLSACAYVYVHVHMNTLVKCVRSVCDTRVFVKLPLGCTVYLNTMGDLHVHIIPWDVHNEDIYTVGDIYIYLYRDCKIGPIRLL